MAFDPIAGFPPLIRETDLIDTPLTLESRGFSTTNIVNISNIMESKKKENLFLAFGTEEEDGVDYFIENMLDHTPNQYSDIDYKKLPKDIVKKLKNSNINKS